MAAILSVFALFNIFYLLSLYKKNLGLIDIAWGLSFVVLTQVSGLISSNSLGLKGIVLMALITAWGLRLSLYILLRSLKLKKEDYRYTDIKNKWHGNYYLNAYFKIYMVQFILSVLIGLPIFFFFSKNNSSHELNYLNFCGLVIASFGLLYEAIADYQKNYYKNKYPGKPVTKGLWRYSRHPNYFGEIVFWWGISFILIKSIPIYLVFLSPVMMTFLLLNVSGITLLEKKYQQDNAYKEYLKKTNVLIPWIVKE